MGRNLNLRFGSILAIMEAQKGAGGSVHPKAALPQPGRPFWSLVPKSKRADIMEGLKEMERQ